MRSLRNAMLAGSAALTLAVGVGVGVAMADPSSTPSDAAFVAVGSGTTQYLANQFSTDYDKTGPSNAFYSWDESNPSTGAVGDTIKTKNDANCSFPRPNGTYAGVLQLQKRLETTGGTEYCVDLARMDRNIQSGDGTGLVSVLFAADLTTWAVNSGGNGVANLTGTDLTAIYTCNASLISSAYSGAVTWKEVGGTSTDRIVPVLPQSGSGVRQRWLSEIGVTTPGSCVVNGSYGGNAIEENEGTNAVYTSTGDPSGYKDVLGIFSGGGYVCQVYTKKCPNSHGGLVLGNIDGKAPLTSSDTLNIATKVTIPPSPAAFPEVYVSGLYLTALNAGTASAPKVPTSPIDLTKFLGQGNSSGWICGTTAQTDITNFGFHAGLTDCGALVGQ